MRQHVISLNSIFSTDYIRFPVTWTLNSHSKDRTLLFMKISKPGFNVCKKSRPATYSQLDNPLIDTNLYIHSFPENSSKGQELTNSTESVTAIEGGTITLPCTAHNISDKKVRSAPSHIATYQGNNVDCIVPLDDVLINT